MTPLIDVAFNTANIPEELRAESSWVAWRVEERDGKPTKVPINPNRPGSRASSTDRSTWGTFAQAVETARTAGFGIGFVFANGFVGIDIDKGVDANGVLSTEAQRIVKHFNSYTEISPSGTGVHIIVAGTWSDSGRRGHLSSGEGLEAYSSGRYFTVSGRHLQGTPPTVEERQDELDLFHTEFFGTSNAEELAASPVDATDEELLNAARAAQNGDKFAKLFDRGDAGDYNGDTSAADFALLTMLAFWTGRDKERIERLFSASALGKREKWLRADYRDRSITGACKLVEDTYKPNADKPYNPVEIVVNGVTTQALAAAGWSALGKANVPARLFNREFSLIAFDHSDDRYRISVVDLERMRYELRRAAEWAYVRTKKEANGVIKTKKAVVEPPLDTAKDMLSDPHPPMPVLKRVVEAPVFDADGSLCGRGYNASGLYYFDPNGFAVPTISDVPTDAEVDTAKNLIMNELLGEFPFVAESDKAHAVAFGLLPFARDLIAGPTPLHLFRKPTPGSGATLLVDVMSRIATGRDQSGMTEAESEAEWRKRITSSLMDMPTTILIDNIRDTLDSGALASALTSMSWTDRILGHSKSAVLPVRCAWAATANSPRLSNELARRTISISLDPSVDRPWLRSGFKHENLRDWTTQLRSELVWAFLTLIRNWMAKGRPAWTGQRLGSYEEWSAVIGGVLETAGIPGFLGSLEAFYEETDVEGDSWRNFVEMWWKQFEDEPVPTADLIDKLFPLNGEAPINIGREVTAQSLGKALRKNLNRVYLSYRIVRTTDKKTNSARWALSLVKPVEHPSVPATSTESHHAIH
jgi:hypothetical protein